MIDTVLFWLGLTACICCAISYGLWTTRYRSAKMHREPTGRIIVQLYFLAALLAFNLTTVLRYFKYAFHP